jgi:hypothetical protein
MITSFAAKIDSFRGQRKVNKLWHFASFLQICLALLFISLSQGSYMLVKDLLSEGGGHAESGSCLLDFSSGQVADGQSVGRSDASDGWYSCDNVDYHITQEHCTGIAPESGVRFVGDGNPGDGSPDNPFQDIEENIAAVPDSVTLTFKTGSAIPFSADNVVIDRPMVFKGKTVIGE